MVNGGTRAQLVDGRNICLREQICTLIVIPLCAFVVHCNHGHRVYRLGCTHVIGPPKLAHTSHVLPLRRLRAGLGPPFEVRAMTTCSSATRPENFLPTFMSDTNMNTISLAVEGHGIQGRVEIKLPVNILQVLEAHADRFKAAKPHQRWRIFKKVKKALVNLPITGDALKKLRTTKVLPWSSTNVRVCRVLTSLFESTAEHGLSFKPTDDWFRLLRKH